jgi:hypothetical protein
VTTTSITQVLSDPQNLFWANDSSKFGQKMLEKMGWQAGKGIPITQE